MLSSACESLSFNFYINSFQNECIYLYLISISSWLKLFLLVPKTFTTFSDPYYDFQRLPSLCTAVFVVVNRYNRYTLYGHTISKTTKRQPRPSIAVVLVPSSEAVLVGTGYGTRVRVLLVINDRMRGIPESLLQRPEPRWARLTPSLCAAPSAAFLTSSAASFFSAHLVFIYVLCLVRPSPPIGLLSTALVAALRKDCCAFVRTNVLNYENNY